MLGRQFADPIVQRELSLLPYKVSEHPQTGRPIINMDYMGKTHEFTPEQVKKLQESQDLKGLYKAAFPHLLKIANIARFDKLSLS